MFNQNLKQLKLRNFRSHEVLDLNFDSQFVYFFGPNGIGKTNIIEAISLFSPGRGLRGANIGDLKRINSDNLWNLSAIFNISNVLMEIEIGIDNLGKKFLRIDGKKKPLICLNDLFKILWLTPIMDRLWIGSASERRRFLDRLVMIFFSSHAKNCILYDQALKKRNLLLKENEKDIAWFLAVEKQLSEIGYLIDKNRRNVIDLLIGIQLDMNKKGFSPILDIQLDTAPLKNKEALLEELKKTRKSDIYAKRTSIGTHRTDLLISHNIKNIQAKYCSTGEQKSLLLSIFVLSSLAIEQKFGNPPIILLDEIVAHLDKENLSIFFEQLFSIKAQIFATGTEKRHLDILPMNFLSYSLKFDQDTIKVDLE